jgi:hypothetical protein
LATNAVLLGKHGTLEILMPKNWTLGRTNLNLPGNPPTVELHSADDATLIRLTIFWDGFEGQSVKPTAADMEQIVSNSVLLQYVPIAVEKTVTMETLKGAGVSGSFARFTDAGWTPVVKDERRNLATGMFRCGKLWGNFDLLTGDKDGPEFKQGLEILESLRQKP